MASITRFYALILSTVLLISGVPGFFPSIGQFKVIVAIFALTLVHATVHAAVGVLGLLIAALASDVSVRIYTSGIAVLYGILAAVGLLGINFPPLLYFNTADNWLHSAIFILSLGVLVVGLAEERLFRRKERILDGLPVVTANGLPIPAPRSGTSGPILRSDRPGVPSRPNRFAEPEPSPWRSQTPSQNPGQNPASDVWAQTPWPPQGQRPSQEPRQTPGQPFGQPRDPWTREQRQGPVQPASQPPQQYPPMQSQWPQDDPYRGPTQGPPPQSPWPQSQNSQNSRPSSNSHPSRNSQNPWGWDAPGEWDRRDGWDREPPDAPRPDQWPLEEWPSLRDPRPQQ